MEVVLVVTMMLVAVTVGVGTIAVVRGVNGNRLKNFLGMNVFTFFSILIGATVFLLSGNEASAAETALEETLAFSEGMRYLAAALSTGLAAIGSGIAVAVSGSAAIGAISEDDTLLGKTVIFVGLAEGIAIYGLIISIMILG